MKNLSGIESSGIIQTMNKSLTRNLIVIRASRDEEAGVWVATSADLPGLVTEAPSLEALTAKLPQMIADLIELDGFASDLPEIPIHIIAEQTARVANPAVS